MSSAEEQAQAQAAEAEGEVSLLDQAISATKQTERSRTEELLKTLSEEALKGTVTWDKNISKSINQAIEAIDAAMSKQLAAVMHHEKFQKLEGTWRGLNYLVMNSETSTTLKIKVLNADKRTLFKDLDKAVEFTYRSQNAEGGWRYAPLARDSDMSITVCQVVALREARNIGIKVPRETIDKALKYVMESAVTGRTNPNRGAFLYQHSDVPFNRNSFALTAAGLTTIYQAGLYSQSDVDRYCRQRGITTVPRLVDCLTYLDETYEPIWRDYSDHYFYFYGNYYATQAWYTRGGEQWRRWYTRVRDDLLSIARHRRGADGLRRTYWESRHVGDVFATAVASIILQVPNHYLPIFQR